MKRKSYKNIKIKKMNFLKKKFFDSVDDVFGLDVSDLSIKILQLEKDNESSKVRSYASVAVSPGDILDGEIIGKEAVASRIKEVVRKAGPKKIKTKKAVCSLPEAKSFLRLINVPKMSEEEIKEAIKWEMEANIPLPLDQVYYDWQVLDRCLNCEKGKMSVVVLAMSKKIVDQFLEVLEMAGLEAVSLEVESIAQMRSLVRGGDDETDLIVDFGGKRTSFLFSISKIPCFTSGIPLSAQVLTDSISKKMVVSAKEAEKIKKESGIGSFIEEDPIFKAVEPVLENMATEIEKTIEFYLSGLKYSKSINKIILCGGGANTKGLVPYLSKRLKRDVEIGDPWINFMTKEKKNIPIISKEESIQYSTAIGLAIKGFGL